ncbi:ethanolamine utilization protein EutJ [Desulfobulbus rhabdoformis]|jgi:ethanolamine utilization protein EutJ|uniref:ethanolamine utilization protein EutJ n=1 Tax=Desulfobulbus rhabdoformis TaxID=34032 RepID=UPI0019666D69|nr:ethanolamine utilization protein EutJ [Desulfobulbus rhabdoformis]MBM9615116.1 ethanolamine utilization protein EutJ [Desulfobulbus rhabdoformis]
MLSEQVNQRIASFAQVLKQPLETLPKGELYAGVDLGTAYIVTAVVDSSGTPVAGAMTRSRASVRDGLVLDYIGALSILRAQMQKLRNRGLKITHGAAAYPPGTSGRNAQAFGHVLESVELEVAQLTDEPSAASKVLDISEGAVIDVGGGTTGISILKDGKVIYTADEATGGTHVDLVIAGHLGISVEKAEAMKCDPDKQRELLPVVRPVFQKMATIVRNHLQGHGVENLYLVGGTSTFSGITQVMADECELPVLKPDMPLLVTPLGIALSCQQQMQGSSCLATAA